MTADALAITFGLGSALAWGAGDFSGGFASRRSSVLTVILLSQIIGGCLLAGLNFFFTDATPEPAWLIWGGLAGIFGTLGLIALYQGLASGRMTLVAPLSAVVTALFPILFAAYAEGLPKGTRIAGFGVALVAVWCLSAGGSSSQVKQSEFMLSLLAGLGFALFFICIDRVSEAAVLWPLISARTASVIVIALMLAAGRQITWPQRSQVPFILLAGVLDTMGNTFFALASRMGRLDVAAVLGSMYPAATVMLAWCFLKERLRPRQWFGLLTALAALGLIGV